MSEHPPPRGWASWDEFNAVRDDALAVARALIDANALAPLCALLAEEVRTGVVDEAARDRAVSRLEDIANGRTA